MKHHRFYLSIILMLLALGTTKAQYVEQEEKDKITSLYPKIKFDSLQARTALARGKGTIKGVAFTKPKTPLGYKAPLAKRIYANKMKVELFPVTPYFEEWYALRKDKENVKKKVFVYMSNDAYRYRLEAITNSNGKFTFPEMKPGKYFLMGFLNWDSSRSYDRYTGTGYNNYGGSTNYYQREYYSVGHQDRIEEFVEVTKDGEILEVKLK